jgi:hypothetical protein
MKDWESLSHVRWDCQSFGIYFKVPPAKDIWRRKEKNWKDNKRFMPSKGN